jgi:hypothetical protein
LGGGGYEEELRYRPQWPYLKISGVCKDTQVQRTFLKLEKAPAKNEKENQKG